MMKNYDLCDDLTFLELCIYFVILHIYLTEINICILFI